MEQLKLPFKEEKEPDLQWWRDSKMIKKLRELLIENEIEFEGALEEWQLGDEEWNS